MKHSDTEYRQAVSDAITHFEALRGQYGLQLAWVAAQIAAATMTNLPKDIYLDGVALAWKDGKELRKRSVERELLQGSQP